jgi:hypothetical protein
MPVRGAILKENVICIYVIVAISLAWVSERCKPVKPGNPGFLVQ